VALVRDGKAGEQDQCETAHRGGQAEAQAGFRFWTKGHGKSYLLKMGLLGAADTRPIM